MENIFKKERIFRALLSLLMTMYATHYQLWWLIIFSVLLLFTAVYHYCPVYTFFGIESKDAKQNFYISQLPKYSPVATFIFNHQGELRFNNQSAQDLCPGLDNISAFDDKNTLIQTLLVKKNITKELDKNNKNFLFHFRYSSEIDSILAYGFDVSELVQANKEIVDTQKELVYHLGEIGETRSKETGNHVKRVARYSYLLAKLSGLEEDTAQLLKTASPLHDIGKIAIPDNVLLKPGKLDKDEWIIMQTHASIGCNLLTNSERPLFKAAAIISGQHHEKWDGSGYPNKLVGEEIHIFGRITAVADVFDALGSERVYKKAWPLDEILSLFKRESGKHFDPNLVSLFLNNLDQFKTIRNQYQES